jgi:hypothetical protein
MAANPAPAASLPLSIVEPIDIGRLLREVNKLDDSLHQDSLRGTKPAKVQISEKLAELTKANSLEITEASDRKQLLSFLEELKTKAPVMHISFASEPSDKFKAGLITWLRTEIHPMVLVIVGLEPNIGAGCTVRTNNKYFNLSLSERLKKNRVLLVSGIKKLEAVPQKP